MENKLRELQTYVRGKQREADLTLAQMLLAW